LAQAILAQVGQVGSVGGGSEDLFLQ